ncbi:hypothetical protein TVAG_117330 [Trichomonas vaginalis G3]|uniref:Uncharacterized protein n=1 Tax=Trichomonas vaginalis (strain ATCC PRA-98 / G3) TaxID=412133 RepID=A2E3S3_TRIV3|nr:hypothetical protein TVAGG3_0507400 [Trichomonas vaginalis G3]EAY12711.1 hypothetical protein TVAG_117330 [Trichomonas vaginalis G3]KAI5517527.1 hypothetical protein TVAGG3_0507400 [Trichomonas vaginalis G3]|eukprot:XP_001324934.1 hypothetical protein [Trichomonas vaginalis G3]
MKNGPMFTGKRFLQSNYKFSEIVAKKFENPFFSSLDSANFYKSTFTKFLDSAISVNSIEIKNKFAALPEDFSSEQLVIINRCSFIRISNQHPGAMGGAIFYNLKKGKLKMFQSQFQWCYAKQRCGAFFSSAKLCVGRSLCLLDCRASKTCMAFQITTTASKARANITASFITFCGAIIPKSEKDQVKFEFVSLDLMNTNFTQNRVLQSGFITLQKLYDAAISRCDFRTNYGPSFLEVYSSFDIYLSYSNVINNNLRQTPIVVSFESPIYITYSYFQDNFNYSLEYTFRTEEGGLIIFGNCYFDAPKSHFGYLKGEVKFPKCRFNVTYSQFNSFNDYRLCGFYTDPPVRTPSPSPSQIVYPSRAPTPTIVWLPKSLYVHQFLLIVTISIMGPILIYAVITKRKSAEIQAFQT